MERANLNGISLEYQTAGTGEPVVFVHGALITNSFQLLLSEQALTDRYRLIAYHRRGYGESSGADGPISIEDQAADCRGLMRHLGIERAHVVGHSLGGAIALHLARRAPQVVNSLVLMEPALALGESGDDYRESLSQIIQKYREGETEAVIEEFLNARVRGDARSILEAAIPSAFEQAVADAETAFECDIAGLMDWEFTECDANDIAQPVLAVLGSESPELSPRFKEAHETLLSWLAQSEGYLLSECAHLMPIENPRGAAEMLVDFFDRHPIIQTS